MQKFFAVLLVLILLPLSCLAGWDSIEISNLPEQLRVGDEITLEYEVVYHNDGVFSLDWSSSDPAVLETLRSGRIRAVAPGNATLTATLRNGSRSFDLEILP